jgi:enamine deaminase RidA (YjgF/YER057c/UK114 family)
MAQTWFTYDAIRANLEAQGLTMRDIRHVAVMLGDVRDFDGFHRVHQQTFPANPPALLFTCVLVVGHRGTRFEIEPTAFDPKASVRASDIEWPCPAPFAGPAATRLGKLVLFAGMLGLDGNGRLVAHANDIDDPIGRRVVGDLSRFERAPGFAAQCWAAWMLLVSVSEKAGIPLDSITKTTVYLRYGADLAIYEEIREAFLSSVGADLPAAEFVGMPGPGPVRDAHVQIEATAVTA